MIIIEIPKKLECNEYRYLLIEYLLLKKLEYKLTRLYCNTVRINIKVSAFFHQLDLNSFFFYCCYDIKTIL